MFCAPTQPITKCKREREHQVVSWIRQSCVSDRVRACVRHVGSSGSEG